MRSKTLYVSRPLLNAYDVIEWAVEQGFSSVLTPDEMHATIAFSKKAIPWDNLIPLDNKIKVVGGFRDLIPLGDKGATVLRFECQHLHKRWQQFLDAGCSWEHGNNYHPHVTLSYEPHNLDLSDKAFPGPLIFGSERFAPIDTNWDKKIKQVKSTVFTKENEKPINIKVSITENKIVNESLTSLLMKNIDLILEAYNVDRNGNLVEVNKKKVAESDDVFHQYFVKSMNTMFRQINEADPILDPMHGGDTSMHPPGDMHGMHAMGEMPHGMGGMDEEDMGLGNDMMGHMQHGMGGDAHMADMAMDDMHSGSGMQQPQHPGFNPNQQPHFESAGDFDWVFGENTDLEIDSLFNLTEDEDEDCDDDEKDEKNEKHLREFMDEEHDDQDFLPNGGGMDAEGGSPDFGGDMGGMSGGMDDDMGGMSGDDHNDMGGGDIMTIHGQTDSGGEFEFKFDKDALDFGDDEDMSGDMGGHGGDDMGDGQMGGGMGGNQMGGMDQMGSEPEDEEEKPFHEAAGRKPGKGKRGPKTSPMSIVPRNPAAKHAAPFPTSMGQRQKNK